MTNKAISLDMETLSLAPNCAVLSVGMVLFDLDREQTFEELAGTMPCFYAVIHPEGQRERFGRHIDPVTSALWNDQAPDAKRAIFDNPNKGHFQETMHQADAWMRWVMAGHGASQLWSFGSASDAVWLESAFKSVGIRFPVGYRDIRCLRSMAAELGVECPEVPTAIKHHAMHDALVQAMWVQRVQSTKRRALDALQNLRLAA